ASATVAIEIANIDGDGMPDFVVSAVNASLGYGELSVYLQRGDSFNLSSRVAGSFTGPFAVGDLNDDGLPDLAAATHDRVTGADTISVFLQHVTDGFGPNPGFQLSVGGRGAPGGVAIGRFTGRTFRDLVARTPGALLVYYQEDLPPVMIRAIPSDLIFNAGASGTGLIDLGTYFADDHGPLYFVVVYEENASHLHAVLAADGHHLDFASAAGWYGSERFQVAATDAGPLWIVSNTFTVTVNALPSFTSPPPTRVRAGEKLLYQVTVADPYPTDDAHTFALLQAPEGMTIDGTTGLVEWTPTA
ncbi:MAG: VCBS repeat-containing protein, partial [Methanobacteriota archaeon]